MHQEKSTATRLTACVAGVLLAAGSASAQPATTPASFDEAGRPLQITEVYNFDPLLEVVKPVSPLETSPENQDLITEVTWVEVTNTSDSEFVLADTRFASIVRIAQSFSSIPLSPAIDSTFVNVPVTTFAPGESVIFCLTPKGEFSTINSFEESEIEPYLMATGILTIIIPMAPRSPMFKLLF
ncbi:MAG: hypothetical protein AAF108_05080 [Planctomycetota bacterium]